MTFIRLKFYFNQFFRLQTGMRGAFGKAHGTAARVKIGQILMSVRSYDKFKVCNMRNTPPQLSISSGVAVPWLCSPCGRQKDSQRSQGFNFWALAFGVSNI